ncbi:MAG: GHKL domain-containing protein [Lachnospiraceae bacterium]|nr:GHKL domain-containing protein [Lachnospiraceae bacterium]
MEPEIYELYYQIAFEVNRGVKRLIAGIMLALLCRHFMVRAKAKRRVWMVGAAYVTVVAVFSYIEVEVYSFTAYLSAYAAAFLVLCCLEKENRQVKFLLCYIFFSVRALAAYAARDLRAFAEEPVGRWIILKSGMSQENIWRWCLLSFCLFCVIEWVLVALILWLICKGIKKIFFFNRNEMEKKEMLLLMLPSTLGIVYYIGSERNINLVLEQTGMYINEMVPEYDIVEIVIQFILIAAIMSMIWLYQKLKREQAKKQSDRLLLQEVKSMRAHIEEVERLHDDLRGMRHDMRNHISVLQGLMKRGAFGRAQEYLDSMGRLYTGEAGKAGAMYAGKGSEGEAMGDVGERLEEEGAENDGKRLEKEGIENAERQPEGETSKYGADKAGREPEIMTGNPVTDVILAEHRRRITEAGAIFETDFHYPDSAAVDAFDLSVILDNALTNALEAEPQGGFIRIRSFREGQAYLIVIENAFEGVLAGTGAEGLPMTTKQPAEEHGFGLRHIKTVVERYHGAMTIEQKGDMVVLSMMLCI